MTDTPRWLLLATLVSAPLLWGSSGSWMLKLLTAQLVVIGVLWVMTTLITGGRIRLNPVLLGAGAYLLLHAWWMTLNAKFVCDHRTVQFDPVAALLPGAPGSIDRGGSFQTALLTTGLVLATWLCSELAAVSKWRRRLLFSMALVGALVVGLGLLQRLTGAEAIYWDKEPIGRYFFGPYRNFDNAAAFINVAWPIAAGLLVGALFEKGLWRRLLWGGCLVLCVAGALVSGSRTGGLLACVLALAVVAWMLWEAKRERLGRFRVPELLVGAVLLLALMAALAKFAGLDLSLSRWAALGDELTTKNYRWLAYQVCLKMTAEAGWFGFGPGTFQCAFPYFTNELGDALKGRWAHAHQDYLQTVIEWGYVAALGWAVFVWGAFFVSIRALVRAGELSLRRRVQWFSMVLAVGGVLLHALVDFPLQIASIQLYVCVLLGFLWAAPRWLQPEEDPARRSAREKALPMPGS